MRHVRLAFLAVVIICVNTGCSQGGEAASYEKNLRPFTAADGALLSADHDHAIRIEANGQTKIATADIRLTPVCNGRRTFIIVGKQAGLGLWLGGNPGCQVIEMNLANSYHEMAFNTFCVLKPIHLDGSCLDLLANSSSPEQMMSRLRQATREEVAKLLNPEPEYDPRPMPDEQALGRFFVIIDNSATQPFVVAPLFGPDAITIIVPERVKLGGGQIGHNYLYIGSDGRYSDTLCQAVRQHGLTELPIKFSGPELGYVQACQAKQA